MIVSGNIALPKSEEIHMCSIIGCGYVATQHCNDCSDWTCFLHIVDLYEDNKVLPVCEVCAAYGPVTGPMTDEIETVIMPEVNK